MSGTPTLLAVTSAPVAVPADPTPVDAGEGLSPAATLTLAVGCLVLAAAALVAEMVVVSFGLLALLAAALAVIAVVLAFSVSLAAGLGMLILASLGVLLALRLGGDLLQRTPWVPKATVTGEAGIQQTAASQGLALGSEGILMTPASPTGRARFTVANAVHDQDVACPGSAERGTRVRIVRIDGPTIFVEAVT